MILLFVLFLLFHNTTSNKHIDHFELDFYLNSDSFMVEVSWGTVSIHQDGLNMKGERERENRKCQQKWLLIDSMYCSLTQRWEHKVTTDFCEQEQSGSHICLSSESDTIYIWGVEWHHFSLFWCHRHIKLQNMYKNLLLFDTSVFFSLNKQFCIL